MADFTLRDDEKVVVTANWTDDQGNATAAPANPVASSSDDTVLTIADNGDGSYTVSTVGPVSTSDVTISVTGDGITTAPSATLAVVVSAAISGDFTFGTPDKR